MTIINDDSSIVSQWSFKLINDSKVRPQRSSVVSSLTFEGSFTLAKFVIKIWVKTPVTSQTLTKCKCALSGFLQNLLTSDFKTFLNVQFDIAFLICVLQFIGFPKSLKASQILISYSRMFPVACTLNMWQS